MIKQMGLLRVTAEGEEINDAFLGALIAIAPLWKESLFITPRKV
jgi:hypothetical protein